MNKDKKTGGPTEPPNREPPREEAPKKRQNKSKRLTPRKKGRYPISYERDYQRELRKVADDLNKAGEKETRLLGAALSGAAAAEQKPLSALISAAAKKVYEATEATPKALGKMRKVRDAVTKYSKEEYRQILMSTFAVDVFAAEPDLKPLLQEWTAANVRLIKSIPEEYFGKLEGIISQGLQEGATNRQVSEKIKKLYDVTSRRARLIARDQMGKLNGLLTKERQQRSGIKYYLWSSSRDERVRESHADYDGHLYAWDGAAPEDERPPCPKCGRAAHGTPDEGPPGVPIQCRCVALPVFDPEELRDVFPAEDARARGIAVEPEEKPGLSGKTSDDIIKHIKSDAQPKTILRGRQNKHIPGTNEYKQYASAFRKAGQYGPSRVTVGLEEIQALVDKYHGTGKIFKKRTVYMKK